MKNFLIDCTELEIDQSMNSDLVLRFVSDALTKYDIGFDQLSLILSDAARYMIKAGIEIRKRVINCFHVTCFAHLIHNCGMNIKGYFEEVNKVISCVKAITIKNKSNSMKFSTIGNPPSVIVTRWSSWLKAAMYYCKNLPKVREIVNWIDSNGILIERAKDSLRSTKLVKDLLSLKVNYESLIELLDKFDDNKFTVDTEYNTLCNIKFKNDPVGIKSYLEKKLTSSETVHILKNSNVNISPEDYLYNCCG